MDEKQIRLDSIAEMIDNAFNSGQPMLLTSARLLEKIQMIALGVDEEQPMVKPKEELDHVIISCDASIKKNPGGPSSVGFVIQDKNKKPVGLAQLVPATTNNQAEYDAIYEGLKAFMGLNNNPGCEIEIRSDSQLVIKQLRGEMKCNDPQLEKRKEAIWELARALPVLVKFEWRPRNSTPELESANYLAQDLLDVPRH